MARLPLFALVLALTTLALPASAGDVAVGTMTGTQYDYPLFTAYVQATGTYPLTDVHLVVNHGSDDAVVVQPDKVERSNISPDGTYVIWTIYKYSRSVVRPGDALTAVVRDEQADSGQKAIRCGPGSTKKKSRETAACRQ